MKSALVVIAAVLAASGQSVYSGSSDSGGTATWGANMSSGGVICGSPNYNCAVTDNQAHLPTATVNLGNGWAGHSGGGVGANIVAIDHSLALPGTSGAKILRLTDGVNVANYARTFSGGGHNVISAPQANGKRYVAVAGAGGVPCMFEFDEAAMANAVEGQVCAGCSRKLWCTVSASATAARRMKPITTAACSFRARPARPPTAFMRRIRQPDNRPGCGAVWLWSRARGCRPTPVARRP